MGIDWGLVLFVGFVLAFAVILAVGLKKGQARRKTRSKKVSRRGAGNAAARRVAEVNARSRARDEALFVAQFPDLHPHYHPEALVQFVRANLARNRVSSAGQPFVWKRPPGFGVPVLEIQPGTERVLHVMRDDSGAPLSAFHYDDHPEGAVLRVGEGKFTVNVKDAVPRVRYWHPKREFKWSENKGWMFLTAMAAAPFAANASHDSAGSSTDWTSRDSGDSRQPLAGAGGTFDGGGATGSWEGGSGAGDSSTSTSY